MKKLLFGFSLIFSLTVLAGHDTGGGGIGLEVNKQIYLYDFVEAGIEDNIYINANIDDEMNAKGQIKATLLVSPEAQKLVVAKLNEIYKISPSVALDILGVFKRYQWRFVKPSLISTRDIGRTPINTTLERKQIAFRDDASKLVTIDSELLAKMPLYHQVGLYFHEALYALSSDSDSYKARLVTSFLFHPSFEYSSFELLDEQMRLVSNKVNFNYSDYTYITSEEFKNTCSSLKEESHKFVENNLVFLDGFYRKFKLILKEANSKTEWGIQFYMDWFKVIDKTITYKYVSYTVVDRSIYNGANSDFYYPENAYISPERFYDTKKQYSLMTADEKQKILNIKKEALELLDKHKHFKYGKGQCLDQEAKDVMINYFSKLNVVNNVRTQ